jgi:hypothetical protein
MSLTKINIVDRIEVTEHGAVQVRTKTAIVENGEQISGTFHRHIVAPGDDYSNEDAKVKAICAAVHTSEVIAAYQAMQPEQIPA